MNIVILLPVKNEEWILPTTIIQLKKISKNIIVFNQNSIDKTSQILAEHDVQEFKNKNLRHSNKVRWEMLTKSREIYGYDNFIICIDADELLPLNHFNKFFSTVYKYDPGTVFSSPWLQMWRSKTHYRNDNSVWNPKNNRKDYMFIDSKSLKYENHFVINDHTSRVPSIGILKKVELKFPLIHLQFMNWDRSQIKQIWYQFHEILEGINAEEINNKYKNSFYNSNLNQVRTKRVKKSWLREINFDSELLNCNPEETWYYSEIKKLIIQNGIKKFESLNVWDLSYMINLKKIFT